MIKRILFTIPLVLFIVMSSGCAVPATYGDAKAEVNSTSSHINYAKATQTKAAPSVVVKNSLYVNAKPISLAKQPSWLSNRVSIQGSQLPLSFYLGKVLNPTGSIITYGPKINQSKALTMNYTGTIRGFLKELAGKTGYAYQINNNQVNWTAFVTRTFNISFMPGASTYQLGGKYTGSDISTGSSGGSGGSGGSSGSGSTSGVAGQYSQLDGKISVWKDLQTTLDKLKSPQGSVSVSQATTSVTVHDHPSNVRVMARYLHQLNINLSKQVLIKVKVLDVTLNKDFSFGINWNLIGKTVSLSGNLTSPLAISPNGTTTVGALGFGKFGEDGTGDGALINALQQQGKVSVVTSPEVVTLNNQVAEIDISNTQAYLQSVENTTGTGGSSSSSDTSSVSLTPGTFSTGFTMFVLPKIDNKRVYLSISSSLSNLVALNSFSSSGLANQSVSDSSNASVIQLPNIDAKNFNQRSVVHSGTTLVLAGFRQVTNQANESSLFGVKPLGGRGASQSNLETVVLITPVILRTRS